MINSLSGKKTASQIFLVAAAFLIFSIFSCNRAQSSIAAYKTGDKIYLYSEDPALIDSSINDNPIKEQIAANYEEIIFIKSGGAFFLDPLSVKTAAEIISGNLSLIEQKNKSSDGYAVPRPNEVYREIREIEETETIGETILFSNIELLYPDSSQNRHSIIWTQQQGFKASKKKAVKNCQKKFFWASRYYMPGTKTLALRSAVFIPVKDILDFYNSKIIIKHKDNVFYFTESPD